MNLSLRNSTGLHIQQLEESIRLSRETRIEEMKQILSQDNLIIPERATHIDFVQLGMTELPIDLSDCDIEIIESLDGQCLMVTTYHDVDALMKDAPTLHRMIQMGTAYQSGLKAVVQFDAPTASVVRKSLAKALAAK